MELISDIEKVLETAFGPNGRAILFVGGRSSSINSTTPVISRTGLEIMEILSSKNDSGTVHPLLKSLVETCRNLNAEWGDGIKSLVLITCELLRLCASLDSCSPFWLRTELHKAICCLQQISKSIGSVKKQGCADSQTDDSKDRVKNIAEPSINSLSCGYFGIDVLNQFEMFFVTRFPSHICDVVSPLLFKWVSSLAEKSSNLSLEFVVENFNFLSHVDVGQPTDQSSLIKGILFHGVGIGSVFETERKKLCKSMVDESSEECLVTNEIPSLTNYVEIKFITEDELNDLEIFGKSTCIFDHCLCLTSSFVKEAMEFKIKRFGNVSLIHSVPKEEIDFICRLLQCLSVEKSFHLRKIECVRSWTRGIAHDSAMIWLDIPNVETLVLSVPTSGISEGLKNSCWNALRLISQFNYYIKKPSEPEHATKIQKCGLDLPNSNPFPLPKIITFSDNSKAAINMLPFRKELDQKELVSDYLASNVLIDSGGHAEMLFHSLISGWSLAPPSDCSYPIDSSVTEAISKACLKIPRSLGNYPLRKLSNSLSSSECNHKELITHRIMILQYAVTVVQEWSNISHLQSISSLAKSS